MRVVTAAEIDEALSFPSLIEGLADAFRGGIVAPGRHHHTVPRQDGPDATLLLMPAWTSGDPGHDFAGVKVVSVHPSNSGLGLPSVLGTYLLMDGASGMPLAALDGTRLTVWRTGAASALAARHLAREDCSRMVMVGAGALAPFLIRAHLAVRPIRRVMIWSRRPEAAAALAGALAEEGLPTVATEDLAGAIEDADVISCATLSREPLVRGQWLKPGAHLDLVGAFAPNTREADDAALLRAALYVDTVACAHEGGDVAAAIQAGSLDVGAIRGDLAGLASGRASGRQSPDEITVFKSIGTSLEDLAAAMLVWRNLAGR